MEHYGFWSLLPPVLAIILAIRTRQVFLSLFLGVWLGWMIVHEGNLLTGTLASIEALVAVFESPGNTRTIMFCALVGALIVFIQKSGGVAGFIEKVHAVLEKMEQQSAGRSRFAVPFFAWAVGVLIFVESSISSLTVGTLFRPVFDKMKISREKLAWIADSSSAPSSILIPFNGWGAFIMGLLAAEGYSDPFATMIQSIGWNFYPLAALLLVPLFLYFEKDIGPMSRAEKRVRKEGKVLPDKAQPLVKDELTGVEKKPGVPPRAYNMVLPIATMVLMMPLMLAYTGWAAAVSERAGSPVFEKLLFAIGRGSGSTAVLLAVLTALFVSMILYRVQGIFKTNEMIDMTIKGIGGLIPLAILMVLAFAIGSVCQVLGTGAFVAEISEGILSPSLVPLLTFLASCFIAFSTGTSWGTFAIMIPIVVPLAHTMGANEQMVIAAALGGGVFGDHCSPISDTSIISSMAAACDHIDHVRTQLPYALIGGGLAAAGYLLMGIIY